MRARETTNSGVLTMVGIGSSTASNLSQWIVGPARGRQEESSTGCATCLPPSSLQLESITWAAAVTRVIQHEGGDVTGKAKPPRDPVGPPPPRVPNLDRGPRRIDDPSKKAPRWPLATKCRHRWKCTAKFLKCKIYWTIGAVRGRVVVPTLNQRYL